MQISEIEPSKVKTESIRERMNRQAAARTSQFLVYKNETEAGYITFVHRPDIKTGVLYEVFVLPEFRCTGIGARLVAYTENLSRCAGYSRVRLSVCAFDLVTEASVTEAWLKTWYQKLGYTIASDGTGEYEKRLVST